MGVLDNIQRIIDDKNITQKQLAEHLGLHKNAFTNWKSGQSKSYMKYIPQIAEFLGVSIQEIYGNTEQSNIQSVDQGEYVQVPLYESVSAGFGEDAENEIVGYVSVLVKNPYDIPDTLCLKVLGDSMSPKILDGDIIQVRKQEDVDNRSIAVVMVFEDDYENPRGFVKQIIKGKNYIELHSLNETYKPMRFEKEQLESVKIVGLVQRIVARDL